MKHLLLFAAMFVGFSAQAADLLPEQKQIVESSPVVKSLIDMGESETDACAPLKSSINSRSKAITVVIDCKSISHHNDEGDSTEITITGNLGFDSFKVNRVKVVRQ